MIVPRHLIAFASSGMISKGLRWMFDSGSPFYIKPRFSGDLVRWGYQFYKHSTKEHVVRSIPIIKEISQFSKSLYKDWSNEFPFDFGYQERGLLMLYQSAGSQKEEIETAHLANHAGVEALVLSQAEVQKLEPDVRVSARGGVYYPGDAHLDPQ